MSLADCIDEAVAGGEMDAKLGEQAKALFQKLQRDYARKMAGPAADAAAADETLRALTFETMEKHRKERLQMLTQAKLLEGMNSSRGLSGEMNEAAGLGAVLAKDPLNPHLSSVEGRAEVIRNRAQALMADLQVGTRSNILGAQKNADQGIDVVRESFGQDSGNAQAKLWFRQWSEAAEYLRQRLNRAGGAVAKIEGGYIPYRHDSLKIRNVRFEEWKQDALSTWDIGAMRDVETGLPLPVSDLDTILKRVWENITHEGWNKITPSGQPRGQKFGADYAQHRFVKFKSAEDWLAYNEKYGDPNPFNAMHGYVDRMSRDIALMEILGPNPNATMRWAQDIVMTRAAARDANEGGTKHMERAESNLDRVNTFYEHVTNTALRPVDATFADSMGTIRNFLTSAQLGGAFLSSISDLGLQRLASKHAGLPQWRSVYEALKLFSRNSDEDRKLALRLSLGAEGMNGISAALSRYLGEISGSEWSRRFADATMRLSGLSAFTRNGVWGFKMSFMGGMADRAGKGFDELEDAFRHTLQRYGFDAQAWDAIRATPIFREDGATYLRPLDIDDERLATRVAEMIEFESEYAVPTGTIRGRTVIIGNTRPGTLRGEALRASTMYKTFAIQLVHLHGLRLVTQDTFRGKASYAASLLATMTLMGGLAMQLKEISKGRDPRAVFDKDGWPDPKFVGAAIMQGGGLGIFGDLLFSSLNRFDRSLAETAVGPMPAFANDALNLTLGNAVQLATGEDTGFGNELTRFLRAYTPGGSLWYARLAYERLALDQMQMAIDPQAERRFRRKARRWQREFGQDFWWKQGDALPDRMPDLAAVGG